MMAIVFGSPEARRIVEADRRFIDGIKAQRLALRKELRAVEKKMLETQDDEAALNALNEWRGITWALKSLRQRKLPKAT